MELLHDVTLQVPPGTKKSPFRDYMAQLLGSMADSRTKLLEKITLHDIIHKS